MVAAQRHWVGTFLGLILFVACGSDASSSKDSATGGSIGGSGNFSPGASTGGSSTAGGGAGGATLPPEVEVVENFEQPQAGAHFVYVANPPGDRVEVIDATTLDIESVEAGDRPTYLRTVAGTDAAIVVNAGSNDITIVRTGADGSRTSTVGVVDAANVIRVSPDGKHAVVYYDPAFASASDPAGSFQDVTVVTLDATADRSVDMTVGFRPTQVSYSADGTRAFVVTEDGVSILDFASIDANGSSIAPLVSLGDPGIAKTLDVSITPDGRYALAREEDASSLRLVDLDSGTIQLLDLNTIAYSVIPTPDAGTASSGTPDSGMPSTGTPDSGMPSTGTGNDASTMADAQGGTHAPDAGDAGNVAPPATASALPPAQMLVGADVSDVDLAPSGTFALAVIRNFGIVVQVPIPGGFDDPATATAQVVEGELVGQAELVPDETRAILFTTARDDVERITILNLDGSAATHVQLRKAVESVTITPDGLVAFVRHKKLDGDPNELGIDLDTQIDRSYGYSLVRLDTVFAKLQVTQANVGPSAIVPDSSFVFMLFDDPNVQLVERARLDNFQIDDFGLGSTPLSIGVVPASTKVFIGQEHPDGRLTFIDWSTADVRTVTGFELNSRIRE